MKTPVTVNNAVNAAQHVWGYVKDEATELKKKRFQNTLKDFLSGKTELGSLKNVLHTLAQKHREEYLLNAYYFYM